MIAFSIWRRVVLGAGAGVVFGAVLAGFLALTGALTVSEGALPLADVAAGALAAAMAAVWPWLLVWLIVVPAVQRLPVLQPWLALAAAVGVAVWLVPRVWGVAPLSASQQVGLGLVALAAGLAVVRAADVWLSASFLAAAHVVLASMLGLPFGGPSAGWLAGSVNGDTLVTGGTLGPLAGMFGMLGMCWLVAQLLQHQAIVFAGAAAWHRSRAAAWADFGVGAALAVVAAFVLLACLAVTGAVRVRSVEVSLAHVAAAVPLLMPAVLAEELWARLGLVSGLTLVLRRRVPAAVAAAFLVGGLHWWLPAGATVVTAASAAASALVGGLAYARTGRLWMPVALAFGWRLAEGPLLGLEGHGLPLSDAWLQRDLLSFSAWSGGVHGIDTGVWALLVKLTLAAAVFLVTAGRKDAA